jgi:hypothetical protein
MRQEVINKRREQMNKRTVHQSVFDSKEARRVQAAGHKQAVEELERTPRHLLDDGNPNHPMYDQLFGYDREEFMAKQYK